MILIQPASWILATFEYELPPRQQQILQRVGG